MKPIYILAVVVLFTGGVITAQPVLHSTNSAPLIGETFTTHAINFLPPGPDGPLVLWDFSQILSAVEEERNVVSPEGTLYKKAFPGSNTAIEINAGTDGFHFYNLSSGKFNYDGFADGVSLIYYHDPMERMNFPFTYNSTFTDVFASEFHDAQNIKTYRSGEITALADGFGTLKLPFGTYENVLRVKYIESYKDSLLVGAGYQEVNYERETYSWFLPGTHQPLLTISQLNKDGQMDYQADFLDMNNVIAKVKEAKSNASFKVYPNPANDEITIELDAIQLGSGEIILYNLSGQVVLQQQVQVSADLFTLKINLQDIPAGGYLLTVNMPTAQSVRLLEIQ